LPRHRARHSRPRVNRRRPDVGRLLRNLLAIGLIAQTAHVAFCSPRLAVRRVVVHGTERLAPDEVRQLAGVHLGINTFRVNLGRVAQRLRRNPQIRTASVTRQLPATIAIVVEERQPTVALAWGGRFLEVDREGVIYREATAPPADVPLVRVEGGFVPAVGARVPGHWLEAALACVALAREHHLRLVETAIDAQGELWLHITTPATRGQAERVLPVRLGRPEQLAEKFADISLWLPQVAADGEYLNVMCAGRAAYLPLGALAGEAAPSP